MAEGRVLSDPDSPPSEELEALGRVILNLYPTWDIRLSGEIDSTNAEARRICLSIGGDAWTRLIMTDFQSEGRGRLGRSWIAPAGTSLMFTVMGPMKVFREPRSLLPLAAGCWALEGIERCHAGDVALKWPNDLLAGGRKVGGILCESTGHAILIGIGINLEQTRDQLPERGNHGAEATSLRLLLGDDYPGRLPCSITILQAVLEGIENPESNELILERYRDRCISLGTSVAFQHPRQGTIVGVAEDIDPSGALVVDVQGKGRTLVTSPLEEA